MGPLCLPIILHTMQPTFNAIGNMVSTIAYKINIPIMAIMLALITDFLKSLFPSCANDLEKYYNWVE